ncbi:MAG TPA: NADP-dependent malic enzyme [Alphaproteobacteria bacterium]|jgi:malate dehydrogenase (oxaloacetate-decarboxylating)(NADP+)|nr:NADP-dependent malic enzyme [Alphaproteobacteria bacterium]HCO89814.1 NADP-dependent malic enzyme [Alphaproteobacteria bacterium]
MTSRDKKKEKASRPQFTDEEALLFHTDNRPGKIEIVATKPLATQRDLSLAYSPGVAVPVRAIAEDPTLAYDYTAKGNLVAVISNGTAILGLGDLGALASKPVMEGKAVLFKRFADVDSIDLELDTSDTDEFIAGVRYLGPSFGGINLEDIKAPDCFIIEQRLRELMDIPVFHDDQHGTAIISAAALINALHLANKDIADVTVVVNGAGAAGIACLELIKAMGLPHNNAILCDSKGVVYQGRKDGMNQWKSAHAVETEARSLEDAMVGADVFLGLSVKGAVTEKMVRAMADNPVIFAMANPDPEILPETVDAIREDAIIATGRSDYPNQVNNVLGFPYIFRGALDVRATTINDAMKIAAAEALAELAREDVPDEVAAAYAGERPKYGPKYIIPVPFDPRLISHVPPAVAKAAMDSGVARKPIIDMDAYQHQLRARLDPMADTLRIVYEYVRANPKRMVFAEGEEEQVIRAALSYRNSGYGLPILIGLEEKIRATLASIGLDPNEELEIHNPRESTATRRYRDFLYERLQRKGFLIRDCTRLVTFDRNVFGAAMVACGDADCMVTGVTRNYAVALQDVERAINTQTGHRLIGVSLLIARGHTVFVADTTVHEMPTAVELADIAEQTAAVVRRMGHEPRVALLASSTFGNPATERSDTQREAVAILERRKVDFEFDGDIAADVALNPDLMKLYPFCRLTAPANVLIMPAIHSASISTRMVEELGGGSVVGPFLIGLERPVQIAPIGATVSEIVNMAALAAFDLSRR